MSSAKDIVESCLLHEDGTPLLERIALAIAEGLRPLERVGEQLDAIAESLAKLVEEAKRARRALATTEKQ